MATQEGTTFPGRRITIGDPGGTPATEDLLQLWRRMVAIRRHEEIVEELNAEGLLRGSTHLYIGMEAGGVGVVSTLSTDDIVIGYYRSHGHALACGVPAREILAEILGRVGGCCGGRGGTKHLMDTRRNYLGAYAIVGQHVALATGLGIAVKQAVASRGRAPSIVVCFFGDGAANQGTTLEALNLAAVFSLPLVFVCENNQYAVSSPARVMVGGGSVAARARGFGMSSTQVDGMDVLAVREAAAAARGGVLSDGRPCFLELLTYRYRGHSAFAPDESYRPAEEVRSWVERDPITNVERLLSDAGVTAETLGDERAEIDEVLRKSAEWARNQPVLQRVDEADMYSAEVTGLDQWGAET